MIILVTDIQYRMTAALLRELSRCGHELAVCQYPGEGSPLGFWSKYPARRIRLEDGSHRELLRACRALCEQSGEKIALLPVGSKTLVQVSGHAAEYAEYCRFCVPSPEALERANDKSAVAAAARELGIPVPEEYAYGSGGVKYPCVVKPVCGEKLGLKAGDRYRIARNEGELRAAYQAFAATGGAPPIVQEYVGGFGAGVSLLMNPSGEVGAALCHRRIREFPVTGGPSSCCVSFCDQNLIGAAAKLLKSLDFTGIAMVEFRGTFRDGFKLLEVNPRVWGTFPLTFFTKSGFARSWLEASLGAEPAFRADYKTGVRMKFTFSELGAFGQYLKKGRLWNALGALGGALNPFARDGVLSFADPKLSLQYIKSVLSKGKNR